MPRSAIGVRYVGGPRDGESDHWPDPLPSMIVVAVMPEISAAAIWDDVSPFAERVQYYPVRAPYGDSVWLYVSGDIHQDLVRGVLRNPERFDPDIRAALAVQVMVYRLLRGEMILGAAETRSSVTGGQPAVMSGREEYPWDAIARETELIGRIDELTRDGPADPASG